MLSACGEPDTVEVRTRINRPDGDAATLGDLLDRWQDMTGALAGANGKGGSGKSGSEDEAPTPLATKPPRSEEELTALLAGLAQRPFEDLPPAAANLAAADPSLWPTVKAALLAPRKHKKREHTELLDVIGGDVPNRYGHFDRHWKRAHGYRVVLSEDWLGDLSKISRVKIGKPMLSVYREVLTVVALLHAAGHAAKTSPEHADEIIDVLIEVAYAEGGTFRDEIGRVVQGIGEPAVPRLLHRSVRPSGKKDDAIEVKQSEYAKFLLDELDRAQAKRAIAARRDDPRALAKLLDAYAVARPGDAARPILELVDASSPIVRARARAAFLSFVEGEMPAWETRTIRLLGGGTSTQAAHLSPRALAAVALRDTLSAAAPELLEPACKVALADGTIDEHCQGQPARHAHAWFEWLDARRHERDAQTLAAALAQPKLDDALAGVDALMTTGAGETHRGTLVPWLLDRAQALRGEGNTARAAQLVRKATLLVEGTDPEAARKLRVEALLLEAMDPRLEAEGRRMLVNAAARIDEEDPRVARALAKVETKASAPDDSATKRFLVGAVLLSIGLAALARLPGRRRRRVTAPAAGA